MTRHRHHKQTVFKIEAEIQEVTHYHRPQQTGVGENEALLPHTYVARR